MGTGSRRQEQNNRTDNTRPDANLTDEDKEKMSTPDRRGDMRATRKLSDGRTPQQVDEEMRDAGLYERRDDERRDRPAPSGDQLLCGPTFEPRKPSAKEQAANVLAGRDIGYTPDREAHNDRMADCNVRRVQRSNGGKGG